MKNINMKKYQSGVSEFLFRLVLLVSRIHITITGLILVLSGILGVWGGGLEYLGNLAMGIIFIYPFRRINKLYLMQYFWILTINSLLYTWQSASIGPTTPSYLMWIVNLLSWLNVVSIWQFVRFELNTSRFNPYFSVKKLVVLFGSLGILTVGIIGYLFFNPHYTQEGKSYISLGMLGMSNKKWVEPVFDKKFFDSGYKVSSSVSTPGDSMNVNLELPLQGDGSWELYEKDNKIMHIEYDKNGVKMVTAYDDKSPWGLVSKAGLQPWRRDRAGDMHPETLFHKNDYIRDYNLWIEFGYIQVDGSKSYFEEQKYDSGDWLKIKINKNIEYPDKNRWNPLPFVHKTIPWKLSIKQGDKLIPIVQNIKIWYK